MKISKGKAGKCAVMALAIPWVVAGCADRDTHGPNGSVLVGSVPRTLDAMHQDSLSGIIDVVRAARPCELVWDGPGVDGVVNAVDRFDWDPAGNLVGHAHDRLNDGSVDEVQVFSSDVDSRPLVESWDDDGDGAVDRAKEYVYDAAKTLQSVRMVEVTPEGEAAILRDERFSHDDTGRVISRDVLAPDGETRTWVVTVTYDEDGRTVREDHEFKGDGVIDGRFTYRLDDAGRLVEAARHYDADGAPEERVMFDWDLAGRRVSERSFYKEEVAVRVEYAHDADGALSEILYWHVDSGDNVWVAKAGYDCAR